MLHVLRGKRQKERNEAFEMCTWRRMKKIKSIDRVSNEELVNRINGNRTLLDTVIKM